ncbi:MAG: hypothetical protein HDR11_03820 [Lachnospiraceae bacterium]|nr:hypothetical protein [Lachnospiraceae bacterium]
MARGKKETVLFMLFVFWIPVLAICMCAYFRHNILDIYLPTGWCSDEVSYYKQVEAIIKNGMPQGYWGYNESRAAIGTFGPWSPLCFFPYVIIGSIIGWTFVTPVICNLFFMIVAHYIYFKLMKPGKAQMMWLAGLEGSVLWVTRYAMSAMFEPYVMALELILIGLVKGKANDSKKNFFWIYLDIFLLSVVRPYFLVLFFLPCILIADKKEVRKKFFVSIGMGLLAVLLYMIGKWFLCAEYISGSGTLNIRELIKRAIRYFGEILNLTVNGGATYGYAYALMFGALAVGVYAIWVLYKKNKKIDRNMCVDIYIEAFVLITLAAVLFLYEPYAGSRHMFQATWLLMLAIVAECGSNKPKGKLLIINAVLFLVYVILGESSYLCSIPFREEAGNQIVVGEELKQIFGEEAEETRWQNTIIVNVSEVDYNYVYYLPSYLGIQISWNEWLEEELPDAKSHYLITSASGEVAELAAGEQWRTLYLNEEEDICVLSR